jgi:hypothetical protein
MAPAVCEVNMNQHLVVPAGGARAPVRFQLRVRPRVRGAVRAAVHVPGLLQAAAPLERR